MIDMTEIKQANKGMQIIQTKSGEKVIMFKLRPITRAVQMAIAEWIGLLPTGRPIIERPGQMPIVGEHTTSHTRID